jgi:hypothetical protein
VKRAFAIRDQVVTDPSRLSHDPASFLTPDVFEREAEKIDMRRAARFPLPPSAGDTVWMGAIDRNGLAVSLHPVDLLGMGFRRRPAGDRHSLAEPRRFLLASTRTQEIRWSRSETLPHP